MNRSLKVLTFETPSLDRRGLKATPKNDPVNLAMAARLRKETILTIRQIAALVKLASSNTAYANLRAAMRKEGKK